MNNLPEQVQSGSGVRQARAFETSPRLACSSLHPSSDPRPKCKSSHLISSPSSLSLLWDGSHGSGACSLPFPLPASLLDCDPSTTVSRVTGEEEREREERDAESSVCQSDSGVRQTKVNKKNIIVTPPGLPSRSFEPGEHDPAGARGRSIDPLVTRAAKRQRAVREKPAHGPRCAVAERLCGCNGRRGQPAAARPSAYLTQVG